jgi:hypothetical protein
MFRTLNLGSSSGTHYFKSQTFTPTVTIVYIVKHDCKEFMFYYVNNCTSWCKSV